MIRSGPQFLDPLSLFCIPIVPVRSVSSLSTVNGFSTHPSYSVKINAFTAYSSTRIFSYAYGILAGIPSNVLSLIGNRSFLG